MSADDFRALVRELTAEEGSQQRAAQRLGLSESFVSRVMNGGPISERAFLAAAARLTRATSRGASRVNTAPTTGKTPDEIGAMRKTTFGEAQQDRYRELVDELERANPSMTQAALAEMLGIRPDHLARVRKGTRRVSTDLLLRAASRLSIDPARLGLERGGDASAEVEAVAAVARLTREQWARLRSWADSLHGVDEERRRRRDQLQRAIDAVAAERSGS